MARPIYSLHLFAGAGGGILADLLAGVRPVCAVEIEPFPASILALRFPGLPIWDDVQTFRADNPDCADAFAWLRAHRAELCVAGGFPCQDISSAGLQRGIDGARSGLWRELARILGEVRPRFAFVENSPNLVRLGFGRILGDLASLGYDARWNVLPASAVGARHERERMWIAAALRDANGERRVSRRVSQFDERSADAGRTLPHSHGDAAPSVVEASRAVPDAERAGLAGGVCQAARSGPAEPQRPRRAPFPTPRAHDAKPAGGGRI